VIIAVIDTVGDGNCRLLSNAVRLGHGHYQQGMKVVGASNHFGMEFVSLPQQQKSADGVFPIRRLLGYL